MTIFYVRGARWPRCVVTAMCILLMPSSALLAAQGGASGLEQSEVSNVEVLQGDSYDGNVPGGIKQALLVVPDSGTLPDLLLAIEDLGGNTLVTVNHRTVWAQFPLESSLGDLRVGGVRVAVDAEGAERLARESDPEVAAIARAFARVVSQGRPVGAFADPADALIDDALEQPPVRMEDYLDNLRAVGLDLSDPAVARLVGFQTRDGGLRGNSDDMLGTVSVAVMFVESDGSIDPDRVNWTSMDEFTIVADIIIGLTWWAEQATLRGHSFSFNILSYYHTDSRVQQGYEPVFHHPGTDKKLWVNPIMANFGYNSGDHLTRVTSFNTWLRLTEGTDWAYTTFVCYNPVPWPTKFTDGTSATAYRGGPYAHLLFRSFTWPFSQVYAHESGHIFTACDEYYILGYGGCTDCDDCSHDVNNYNCEYCNPAPFKCMMRANTWNLCPYTPAHLGWFARCGDGTCHADENCATCPSDCGCMDDGVYCNGTEICASGGCTSSGDPCAGGTPLCCENTNKCVVNCCTNAACDDGNDCTDDVCSGGACTHPNNQWCGACCLANGVCIDDVFQSTCAAQTGSFQGSGTVCTAPEACCFGDNTCQMLDPLCCVDQRGTPQGPGSTCGGTEACCDSVTGACYTADRTCCLANGDTPQGPGTVCTTPTACCLRSGECRVLDPLCCENLGGTSYPDEVCGGLEGCCIPDSGTCMAGCLTVDVLCCVEEFGGTPMGAGTACGHDNDGDTVDDLCDICTNVDDAVFCPGCVDAIPTVSHWGLAVLTLLLLIAGKVYSNQRRRVST